MPAVRAGITPGCRRGTTTKLGMGTPRAWICRHSARGRPQRSRHRAVCAARPLQQPTTGKCKLVFDRTQLTLQPSWLSGETDSKNRPAARRAVFHSAGVFSPFLLRLGGALALLQAPLYERLNLRVGEQHSAANSDGLNPIGLTQAVQGILSRCLAFPPSRLCS